MTRKGLLHRWLPSASMHSSTAKSRIFPEETLDAMMFCKKTFYLQEEEGQTFGHSAGKTKAADCCRHEALCVWDIHFC